MASNVVSTSNVPSYNFLQWNSGSTTNSPKTKQSNPNIKPAPKRSNRPTKRTTFTPEQVTLLELEFAKNEYICKDRRSELAQVIDLTECQVKTWFQNRRTKKRRSNSPLRKEFLTSHNNRSPSPFIPPSQQVPSFQTLFQGWPTHFSYSLATDRLNKNT